MQDFRLAFDKAHGRWLLEVVWNLPQVTGAWRKTTCVNPTERTR
jgi:hypothetical protein